MAGEMERPMPLARYFYYVGGVLLALLFISDAYFPKLPVEHSASTASYVIRIHSDRKWPERIVLTSRRSSLHRSRTWRRAPRPRQRSRLPRRGNGRHMRNCDRLMSASYHHPMQKSENRGCTANANLQRNAWRPLRSWWRGNSSLAGLAIGEELIRTERCRARSEL